VIVPDDQLSLAIGRDGQNARLAARLTGWRVDIKSETAFSEDDQEVEYEGEEPSDGHCMAVLSNGRRCPNAAVGEISYCGLPQHQALSRFATNQIAVLNPLAEAEVAILADPDADAGQVAPIVERAEAEFEEPEAEEPAADEPEAEEAAAEEPAVEEMEAEAEPVEAAESDNGGEPEPVEAEAADESAAEEEPAADEPEGEEAAAEDEEAEVEPETVVEEAE